jgi:hypothetical protein
MIESILLIVFICAWVKAGERSANKYCNKHEIDWEKVNEDRTMNDLSNSQVDRNILSGKYDKR